MRRTTTFAAAALAASLALPVSNASAVPVTGVNASAAAASQGTALVEQVQWRRGGWHRGDRGWRRGGGWGIGAGILGGAILGSALAAPYYYDRPYYYYPRTTYYGAYGGGGDAVAYCSSRFRSYDPVSGTYLGYDGLRHPCP